jgi:hypothetical protein
MRDTGTKRMPARSLAVGLCAGLGWLSAGAAPPSPAPPAKGGDVRLDLPAEWKAQHDELVALIGARGSQPPADQCCRPDALILPEDRDPLDVVLRRAAALLADLKRMPSAPAAPLAALEKRLAGLRAAAGAAKPGNAPARFNLFVEACALRREAAFRNPQLDSDQILFVKRHRALKNHMCDQYFGVSARPGGGLFVLSGSFGPAPKLRDVLAGAAVQRGRLAGKKLEGGSFITPDLSYDGATVLFAYVECGRGKHVSHADPSRGHWTDVSCYHIFKVRADGTNLEQLTDGAWNDFAPCWLPNGRIAFISERRGGYGRCHPRPVPTYTLYDMAPDGGDIRPLSVHETNEWHPSVTHEGLIVYTRWDYVDRHGVTAHMPWITTPDGRDSRALHGNFTHRGSRPDMEMDIRAIPGSHKFVATAAPHHGQAFGSLVLIDPRAEDDLGNRRARQELPGHAPVRRITPDEGFPETQRGKDVYGTPWPLSEDYFLCVRDASMRKEDGATQARGKYGIYLVDTFGNWELIYRDAEIACLDPIPLRPRPAPPVLPSFVAQPESRLPGTGQALTVAGGRPAEGRMAVVNTYDSLRPWPEGTRIAALRIIHLLPTSVFPQRNTGVREHSSSDSIMLARAVLGTVPVEPDGSAHFLLPAHKEVYFQALDEHGLAVQSMRSGTYVHPGESLVCQGCHERRREAPRLPAAVPMALRRPPSKPVPDVDGSNPFSYPRLIQPVLDKHCVACHAEKKGKAPNLGREPIARGFYASYESLVPTYAFIDYGDPYRTTPGRFGARASKLYDLLRKGHHDVKLTAEEWHRLTLWLDCSSLFYGVYEKEGMEAQLRGDVVRPSLE